MKKNQNVLTSTLNLNMDDIEDFILGVNINRVRKREQLSPSEMVTFCSLCHKNKKFLPDDILKYYEANCIEDGLLNKKAYFNYLRGKKYEGEEMSVQEEKDYKNFYSIELRDIKAMIRRAITKSGQQNIKRAISENREQIQNLVEQCLDFKSEVILMRPKSIWWDKERMLHIFSAHVKETFLDYYNKPGKKEQTLFIHDISDIKILIQRVLESIDDEVQNHFRDFPNRDFRKTFPETIEFDGDNYSVRINADGKLMMFHKDNR